MRTNILKPLYGTFILLSSAALVLVFQNCGSAGFDGESDGGLLGLTSGSTSPNSRLQGGPFPFDANINQIGYMTCPKAGTSTVVEPAFFNRPYFNIRVGAFDNLKYASDFGLSGLPAYERSERLQAGLRLKPEFLVHLQEQFGRNDTGIVSEALRARFALNPLYLGFGLVNQERSVMEGGFGWDDRLARPALVDLSDPRISANLTSAPTLGGSPFQRVRKGAFAALDPAERSISGSLAWGKNEADQKQLNNELKNNLMLVLGYTESPAQSITDFVDGQGSLTDNVATMAGRAYRLRLGSSAGQGGSFYALDSRFMIGVEELDPSVRPMKSISINEGQSWDCFSLMVVRHIDRIDPSDVKGRPYCAGELEDSGCPRGPRDGATSGGAVVNGVRYVCPAQTITSLNKTVGGVALNRTRLEIARRFLPAEFFDINTDPNHMCVVPTERAESLGDCYNSGDKDASKFIQYSVVQTLPDLSVRPCGVNGGNECPAYVSVCYRRQ